VANQFMQTSRNRDNRAIEEEEQEETITGIILYPKPNDVLIGRGQPYRDLPGNVVWDAAIHANFERYQDSSKFEKTCISMDLVKTVKDTGAHFLERHSDGWKVLDNVSARKKTVVAFRNRARHAAAPNATVFSKKIYHTTTLSDSRAAAKRPRFETSVR
jgi:hypothetical protein